MGGQPGDGAVRHYRLVDDRTGQPVGVITDADGIDAEIKRVFRQGPSCLGRSPRWLSVIFAPFAEYWHPSVRAPGRRGRPVPGSPEASNEYGHESHDRRVRVETSCGKEKQDGPPSDPLPRS
jgi:hypothetical protein